MRIQFLYTTIIILFSTWLQAQELPLIPDHPGTFEILSRTDYVRQGSNFTKAEITANLQRMTELINTVRKNPVLTEMKGFDGRARIYTISAKDVESYGVPSRISFEFASWFRTKDGKETRGFIEPPEWSVIINKLVPTGYQFSSDQFSRNPDFFTIPVEKETIEPGIDLYGGECYVVYDPDRPDYWISVTVKEAFDVVFAENRKIKDQVQREMSMEMLKAEWDNIPPEDWNKPATLSGMLSRVGTKSDFPWIVKVNPAYWNKSRPKSDIQFIYFRMVGDKALLKQNTTVALKNNSTSFAVCRFEESLDINMVRSLKPLVGK